MYIYIFIYLYNMHIQIDGWIDRYMYMCRWIDTQIDRYIVMTKKFMLAYILLI